MSACDMGHPTSCIHSVWSPLCHAEGLITTIYFVTWDGIGNTYRYSYTWNVWHSFMITVLWCQNDNAELEVMAGVVSDCQ